MLYKLTTGGLTALMLTVSPLTLTVSSPVYAQETTVSQEQQGKVTLVDMTAHSERLVAALVRASRLSEDSTLDIQSDTGKPYWTALRSLNEAVGKMANGAALKDKSFHEGLSETAREGAAMFTAYELSGAKDAKIEKVMAALEENVTVLYDAFSKASERAKKGDELSPEEKARFDKIKQQQTELQRRLKAMENKVKKNKRALAALKEAQRRSTVISGYGPNTGDFLAALIALRILDGLIWGCHPWWGPWGAWYPGYSVVIIDIYDDYYDAVPYDWDYYGDVAIDYDLALADDADILMDDGAMIDNFDYIDSVDIDYDGDLSDAALEGLEDVQPEDFENEDLGLDEAMFDDTGALLDTGEDGSDIESLDRIEDADLSSEDIDNLAEEMAPITEEVAPITQDFAPSLEEVAPLVEVEPMDLGSAGGGFDDVGGGFDSFDSGGFDSFDGGGFDDIGGGFDDW